jgi:hypothetical protein
MDDVYYAKGTFVRDGAEIDLEGYVCIRGEDKPVAYGELQDVGESCETSTGLILGRAPPRALHFFRFLPAQPTFDHLFVLERVQSVDGDLYAGLYLGTCEPLSPQQHTGEESTLGVLEELVATHKEGTPVQLVLSIPGEGYGWAPQDGEAALVGAGAYAQ